MTFTVAVCKLKDWQTCGLPNKVSWKIKNERSGIGDLDGNNGLLYFFPLKLNSSKPF